jgi:hypothetical protein
LRVGDLHDRIASGGGAVEPPGARRPPADDEPAPEIGQELGGDQIERPQRAVVRQLATVLENRPQPSAVAAFTNTTQIGGGAIGKIRGFADC